MTVRAQDAKGEDFEMTGEDLLARAFLHETDHLNGKLYITPHQRPEARPDQAQDQENCNEPASGNRPGMLRLVYLGTPAFAVPTLERIVEAGHEVLDGRHAARSSARTRAGSWRLRR